MLSQVAFPKELQNEIDYQLPASVSSYNVKIVPSNGSSFANATQTLTASSTLQLTGSNSNIIFDIPAGQSKSVFIDPRFTTLNFRVNYEITNTDVSAAVITSCQLRSSAYAMFDRQYLSSQSGVLLDDVNLVGLVQDSLLNLETSVADRDSLALMYGLNYEASNNSSQNNNQGHKISGIDATTLASSRSRYYSYSMPFINSLIGKGAKKFFQIGATSKLQCVLQTSSVIPLTIVTGTVTTAAQMKITIDNLFLSCTYVDIGMEGVKMLNKTGVQYYDGVTYRVSSATLPSSSGAISLLTGMRGSSVKALWTRFCEASTLSTTGCINYIYDSKMPQCNSIAYNVNGILNPSNPIDLLRAPATAFSLLQQSNSSFNNYEFKSGLVPVNYLLYTVSASSLPTDTDQNISATTSSVVSTAGFHFGVNLEKISKYGILDGTNLNSGNTFLNMNLVNASTNTLTVFFIAKMDIIYIHDTASGEISVRL
jgi:hypothetical protein